MNKETLVIRPEKRKRRIGIMPTYAQRDRTKYTRKAKHRGGDGGNGYNSGEQHGKKFTDVFPCCFHHQRRISSPGRAIAS